MGEPMIARTVADAEAERPVLSAIRAILRFKDTATIADIARMAEMRQRAVLDVLNQNGHMVWRHRASGKITRVDTTSQLEKQLWDSAAYYQQDVYGDWAVEGKCIRWVGHDDLRARLETKLYPGAVVLDTPENRAAIEAEGLRPWSEAVIDDRLWVEPLAARSTPPAGDPGEGVKASEGGAPDA